MDDILVFVLVLIVLNVAVKFCDADSKSFVIYPGRNVASITCNGSNVINITSIKLKNVPTSCDKHECILSEDDRGYIFDICDGNFSCEVSLMQMSPCISMTGIIDVNYVCQRDVLNCDFEDDMCGLTSDGDWKRVRATDAKTNNDHTSGSRFGRHSYASSGKMKERLISKRITRNNKQCLSFYYWMYWTDDSMVLYRYSLNDTTTQETDRLQIECAHRDSIWERFEFTLEDVGDYMLVIETNGKHYRSTFAVDDLSITNTNCNASKAKSCDFQLNSCGWNGLDHWKQTKGPTKTWYTGPQRDHTTASDVGQYVYMDPIDMSQQERTNLTSPSYNERGELCFAFWYYMYRIEKESLNVYFESESGQSELLLTISGNKRRRWLVASIDINTSETFKMILEGIRGSGQRSDIAIDDISLLSGNCSGFISHQKSCKRIEERITLDECHSQYQSSEKIHVSFDPTTEDCKENVEKGPDIICNYSNYYTYCNSRNIIEQNPACFALNSLMVEYTCEDTAQIRQVTQYDRSNDSGIIGVIAGVISGVLLIAALTCTVSFIIYRHQQTLNKPQRRTKMNDCKASWVADNRGNAVNITNTMTVHSSNKILKTAVHSDTQQSRATSNPSYMQDYDYTLPTDVINASDLDLDNEYMNMPNQQKNSSNNHSFGSKYTVLDPKMSGYNRTKQDVYELAFAITHTIEDNYAESESGQYDISGSSRHRMKDTIYDHSIDGMYDSSHRGRHLRTGYDTYDHTFGKQTEDEYDIAQT